jgi:hypothetical protein
VRLASPREGGAGASPKMKNLMNAPIRRTTDSWPRRNPCVNDSLQAISVRLVKSFKEVSELTRAGQGHQERHLDIEFISVLFLEERR